jgi:hypothetical protein
MLECRVNVKLDLLCSGECRQSVCDSVNTVCGLCAPGVKGGFSDAGNNMEYAVFPAQNLVAASDPPKHSLDDTLIDVESEIVYYVGMDYGVGDGMWSVPSQDLKNEWTKVIIIVTAPRVDIHS